MLSPYDLEGMVAEVKAQEEYNRRYGRLPDEIQYQAAYNPLSMSMQKEAERLMGGLKGFSQMEKEALRTGPSAWANLASQQQRNQAGLGRSRAMAEAAGQTAQARTGLAMRGGVDSGSRERLASQGMKSAMAMSQDIGANLDNNLLSIGMQDNTNRLGVLDKFSGMEMDKAKTLGQAKQMDIQNQIAENQNKNKFAMDMWSKKMETYAANQNSKAIENSGK